MELKKMWRKWLESFIANSQHKWKWKQWKPEISNAIPGVCHVGGCSLYLLTHSWISLARGLCLFSNRSPCGMYLMPQSWMCWLGGTACSCLDPVVPMVLSGQVQYWGWRKDKIRDRRKRRIMRTREWGRAVRLWKRGREKYVRLKSGLRDAPL